MRRHSIASWLLHSVLPAAHAESLLGDLLELAGNDQAKLRSLLLETTWSLLSRSTAGFLLAAVVGGGGMVEMQFVFFKLLALHPATHSQRAWGSTLAALAGCLLIMTCFSVVRYGARDRMTWLTSACIPLLAAAALFWWAPGIAQTAEGLLLALLLGSLLRRDSRTALIAVMALSVLQFVLWFGGIGMLLAPLAKVWRHAPTDAIALRLLALTGFATCYAVLTLLMCVTYAKVRRWVCA